MKPYFSVIFGFLSIVLLCWSKPFLKNLVGWNQLFLRAFCIFFSNEHFSFSCTWFTPFGLERMDYITFSTFHLGYLSSFMLFVVPLIISFL